jgi:hypothetical protein
VSKQATKATPQNKKRDRKQQTEEWVKELAFQLNEDEVALKKRKKNETSTADVGKRRKLEVKGGKRAESEKDVQYVTTKINKMAVLKAAKQARVKRERGESSQPRAQQSKVQHEESEDDEEDEEYTQEEDEEDEEDEVEEWEEDNNDEEEEAVQDEDME